MYLFAFFLVLYEFTTYSANDMIMPGMLQVVTYFNVSEYYVASSFSFYLLGNCIFLLLVGFLSERFGKAKIILWGNFLFLLFTLLIIFSKNIYQFLLFRFFQGGGMAIISVGYALIHEKFNDKSAIKLQALMANVSMLAPLIGPALGSFIMSFWSWQHIFFVTIVFGIMSLTGLFYFTPKDPLPNRSISVSQTLKQYSLIMQNREFLKGMLCSVLLVMPLLIWISQAPNIILHTLHLNYSHYVIYQMISISGLTLASIVMQFIIGKYRMYGIVTTGSLLVVMGSFIILLGTHSIAMIASGILIYGLGMGIANGCIWRLILTIKGHSNTMLATLFCFLQTFLMTVGMVLINEIIAYYHFSLLSLTLSLALFGFLGYGWVTQYISSYRNREWN